MFPETPQTLLRKIADLAQGNDAAEWVAFVELYEVPLRHFVRMVDDRLSPADVEDAVEEVFVRLVEVLRARQIDRAKGKFRAYLASMTRRILIDRYRAALVRPVLSTTEDAADATCLAASRNRSVGVESASSLDPGTLVDAKWRLARRAAAIEHVLTKTAVAEQSKAIYKALVGYDRAHCNLSAREIAARFGVSYDAVKQVKSRLDRAVAAIERQLEI